MKTVPTLLTTTIEEFISQMNTFQRYYDRIQLDIADGQLVPNTTVQINEMLDVFSSNQVTIFPNITFDFHLMVSDYEAELEKIVKIQEENIQVNTVLINASHEVNIGEMNSSYSFSIGLDVFPDVSIDNLARNYDLDYVPSIQIMTVNPGFQGSPFLPQMLQKIEQLRAQGYNGEILIDGGVNSNSLPTVSSQSYQPDIICIGSYLTKAGADLERRINELKKFDQ
ncbi:hypothetical protein IPM65_03235 [Candidatus Roizmanbacteria bacterium]|nr:MAG: hypothetical protein IPM65_03235 [Candidatus Roizmanbacteria bacterium]